MLEAESNGGHQMYDNSRSLKVHYGFGRTTRIFPVTPAGSDADYLDPEPHLKDAPLPSVQVQPVARELPRRRHRFMDMNRRERRAQLKLDRDTHYPW